LLVWHGAQHESGDGSVEFAVAGGQRVGDDGMEESGFVRRVAHPDDRRALLVQLTDQGNAVTAGLAAEYERHSAYLFAGLPPEQVRQFVATMDTVMGRLAQVATVTTDR
jgi:hypothetical protein